MNRPTPTSQAGRILALLEAAHGGKVTLLEILALRISQYSARIHDLRHRFGFRIENGSEPGRPDHTWFRLENTSQKLPSPTAPSQAQNDGLFTTHELERTARWSDNG